MHDLAAEPDFAGIGDHRAAERLDQRRFAGAVVADDREDLAGIKIEIGVVERGDATIALDELSRQRGWVRRSLGDPPDPLVERDRDDDQHADREFLPQHVEPGERNGGAEHADDQRADQRADDRAAAAEQADVPPITTAVMLSRLAFSPAVGLIAPTRPISAQPAIAAMKPAST